MPEFKTPEIVELGLRKCKCSICNKIIIHKESRIKKLGTFKKSNCSFSYNYYFCCDCGKRVLGDNIIRLKDEIKRLRKMDKEINKLKEKNKDIIILSQLENQNDKTKR